ncbi:MAG: hypothetical protein M3R53_04965 [Candidatus Eremiobacteraeota bacterium]|nr:hypothetical protein [Candidatus Eremiobacteraeota bacterium]
MVRAVVAIAASFIGMSAAQPARAQTVAPAAVAPATMAPNPVASVAPAPTGRRLDAFRIGADKIAFYSNRFIVTADRNVDVTLGDGTRITGDTFSLDLRLNRFVVAGDVKVFAGGREIDGAAFAEFLDFDRAYFVPIISEPDRWTFVNGDYAHPLLGRQMPGDTFFLPDLRGERVFAYSKRATIDPRRSVRFVPASLNFGLAFVRFPSYFLNFSSNPNLAQNALGGAFVDGPLDVAGGEHGLATAHIRYDAQNKIYPAAELHQVSDDHYFVVSANPLTRPLKTYNALAFDRISPGLQAQLFVQETAFQHAFNRPLSATAFASAQITGSLPHSYLQLTTNAYYDSLLAQPPPGVNGLLYYGDPTHNWVPDHPDDVTLSWVGYRHPLARLPVTFQLRSSYGSAHNGISPLQTLGGTNVHSIFNKGVGFNLASNQITLLKDSSGRRRDTYLTATFDKQRQYFSLPHHIDTTTAVVSLTKLIDPQKLILLASYTNQNTGDFWGDKQQLAYDSVRPYIDPYTGRLLPGFNAFRGFGTVRSLVEGLVYTPTPILNLSVTLRENHDFPRPIAGPATIVGDNVVFQNFGATPYQASFDLRYQVNRILVFDIGRSYFFGFGGYERWSPQFSFAVVK